MAGESLLIQNHRFRVSGFFQILYLIHFDQFQILVDNVYAVVLLTCFCSELSFEIFKMNYEGFENQLYFHRCYFHWILNQNTNSLDSHLFQLVYLQTMHSVQILQISIAFSFFNEHGVLIFLTFYLFMKLSHYQNIHFANRLSFNHQNHYYFKFLKILNFHCFQNYYLSA